MAFAAGRKGGVFLTHDSDEILGKAFDLRLMRQLLRFLVPYKGLLLVCVVLILVLTGIQIGIPYLSKMAIDNYMIPPLGIVSLSEPPSSANFISLGDKRYLIDLRLIDRETREVWEAMGVLSRALSVCC